MPLLKLSVRDVEKEPEVLGALTYEVGESIATVRERLVESKTLEFPFDIWDHRVGMVMLRGLEHLNKVDDFDGHLIVMQSQIPDGPSVPKRKRKKKQDVPKPTLALACLPGLDVVADPNSAESGRSNVSNCLIESTLCLVGDEEHDPYEKFESKLMSEETLSWWRNGIQRLKTHLEGFAHHRWRVRTWDQEDETHACMECLECLCDLGATKGRMDKRDIENCLANFRTQHLKTTKHQANWCMRRKLPWDSETPKKKAKVVRKGSVEQQQESR